MYSNFFKGKLKKTYLRGMTQYDIDISKEGDKGAGHISVMSSSDWFKTFRQANLEIKKVRREALIYGSLFFDRHPIIFSFMLLADKLLDIFGSFTKFSSEMIVRMRKE